MKVAKDAYDAFEKEKRATKTTAGTPASPAPGPARGSSGNEEPAPVTLPLQVAIEEADALSAALQDELDALSDHEVELLLRSDQFGVGATS